MSLGNHHVLCCLYKGKPPFGFHPHHGLIAMTYVLDGAFDDEDNLAPLNERQRQVNEKGSMCKTNK
jgi:hypothetical protein